MWTCSGRTQPGGPQGRSWGQESPKLAAEPQVGQKARLKCEGRGDTGRRWVCRGRAQRAGLPRSAKAGLPALRAEKGPEECQHSAGCPWTVTLCVTVYGSASRAGAFWPWSHVGTILTSSLWAGILRRWEARPLSLSVPLSPSRVTWLYWPSAVQRGVQVSEGHRAVGGLVSRGPTQQQVGGGRPGQWGRGLCAVSLEGSSPAPPGLCSPLGTRPFHQLSASRSSVGRDLPTHAISFGCPPGLPASASRARTCRRRACPRRRTYRPKWSHLC